MDTIAQRGLCVNIPSRVGLARSGDCFIQIVIHQVNSCDIIVFGYTYGLKTMSISSIQKEVVDYGEYLKTNWGAVLLGLI